ncbi:MAG: hypothetical protein K0Q55_1106 [Verrucomicrobia bacterium]|jgi:hypothetical protein|nr:hypothetical protein [Verrucomicrobiota bacterium]
MTKHQATNAVMVFLHLELVRSLVIGTSSLVINAKGHVV